MKSAPPAVPSDPRLIRLIWIGRLGDILLATPLFAAVRRRWPRARIALVTGDKGRAVARLIADIDEVRTLRPFYHPFANLALAAELARAEDDLLIDLNTAYSRASTVLARLARSKLKVAFRRGKGDGAFGFLLDAPSDAEHMLDRYGRLASALDAPYEPRLKVRLDPGDLSAARDALVAWPVAPGKPRILVHPGNFKKFDNRWPEENFAALSDRLIERGYPIAYLTGPGEEEPVRAIVARLSRPVPVLGPFPVGVTAALLSLMDLVIVNATGTAHLAAAVGTPTFTFLARYTQTVWMPKPGSGPGAGSGHFSVVSDSWTSCRGITVEAALAALDGALSRLGKAPPG